MATIKKKINFFESEEGAAIEQALQHMTLDATYNTAASYSTNATVYPDNLIPFVDKHKNYLAAHPAVNPKLYVSNLRLMTRVR